MPDLNKQLIPERLRNRLASEVYCSDLTSLAFSDSYNKILQRNPEFFPEYTNHGVLHIKEVLEIIDLLIPDKDLDNLSPMEISVIVLSALYHDLAMFITAKMFFKLVKNDYKDKWEGYIEDFKKQISECINESAF